MENMNKEGNKNTEVTRTDLCWALVASYIAFILFVIQVAIN